MSDDQQGTPRPDDETQPVRRDGGLPPAPDPAPVAPAATAAAPEPVGRRGFRERFSSLRRSDGRDRTYGLAALIASALAGVIVGGLGLTVVHAITHDGPGDRGGWAERRDDRGGPGFDRGFGGRDGMHGGPPVMPGQVQPTTPPEEDEGSSS
ncbi:hypothetical protein [Nocardioides baculatus]|uniref:Uncharacterized protein n=1 Tax=Nocardioides baculatus TaxID=2801337 RepID=A0ABS1LC89_9ACTN|nr:hypothetical protein [Nocardioides baculatus]MBL0749310.1 hypothetical protein [Nocardioides baculatus]